MLYLLVLPWTEDAAEFSLRQEDYEFKLNLGFTVSVPVDYLNYFNRSYFLGYVLQRKLH